MRQDTFTLDDADVTMRWPERLSKASYEDIQAWLEIMRRKMKRAISTPDSAEGVARKSSMG